MNRKESEVLRKKLVKMRSDASARVATNTRNMRSVDSHIPGDFIDRSSDDIDQTVNAALTSRDRALIARIDAALKKLDEGVLDVCVECEGEIPFDRLNAKPWASRCISCQENSEESAAPKARQFRPITNNMVVF